MKRILIRGARQLLTLRGTVGLRRGSALTHLGIIENGAVLIDKGLIVEVGPTRRVENLVRAKNAREIDASGFVVMPGLVDCHAHLVSGLATEYPRGPNQIDRAAEAIQEAPAARLKAEAEELLRMMCSHGTTTLSALTGMGLSESAEVKSLRVLGSLVDSPVHLIPSYFGLDVAPPEFRHSTGRYLDQVCRTVLPSISRRGLTRFAHAACGMGNFTGDECLQFMESARGHAFALRMDFAKNGRTEPLGAILEADLRSVDHLEHAGHEDVLALASSRTVAVLLPGTSYHSRSGRFAPARALVDSGAAIALGTDFNRVTGAGWSMQFAIYLACRDLRLTLEEAITAATINSAEILRLDHRIGSIEPGKQADLLVLRVPDHRSLACEYGVNLVNIVIKAGEIVYGGSEHR
jgi:imidazolonepropionase